MEDTVLPCHVMTLPDLYESTEVAKYTSSIESVVYRRIPIKFC